MEGLEALDYGGSWYVGSRPRRTPSPDLSVESGVVRVSMQAILRMFVRKHWAARRLPILLVALVAIGLPANARADLPSYEIEQGVALADAQNPEIIIARKKV